MKTPALILILLFAFNAQAQNEKRTDSKITNVTVFLNKAQVFRKASARLEAGKTNVIISGLTSSLDQQSIQVSGKGDFIIHGINHQQNYLNEFNEPKALKHAKDSLELIQRQIGFENSQKEILNREEQMILSNQKIGGANQNLTAAELKAMADFYRTRLTEIITARLKIDERMKKLTEAQVKLQRQVAAQNDLYSRNTSEIVVSVSASAPTTAELEINYIVSNAGWSPLYDLRAINTKSPVTLIYKANVFQNTGEEWKNVRLKLSTANPTLGGQKPELTAWYLNFYQPIVRTNGGRQKQSATGGAYRDAVPGQVMDAELVMAPAQSTSDFVTTIQTSLNTEFDIALPYTVNTSAKPTLVDIRTHELKADYIYSVAPKLDNDAFLIGRATGWESFSLLPGEANIFFEGTFVGKSFIDPNNIRDTLNISLGRDKRIVVKREKLTDFNSRKLIGTNQRETHAFEISVRNTKTEPIKITIEDQLPVSQNSMIEVTIIDVNGAQHNPDTGKLTWQMEIQPSETKKVVYKFEVKYPKDKIIAGLN
ncbi:MAG TPA: DUF4139 domain-containing protein [Chryseosolibacter sp.]|nr:DUF4139 domain-containing protein [Chryseosolibacter sp.]